MGFSKQLLESTKLYFKKRHGICLSDDEADQALLNLAKLGFVACNAIAHQTAAVPISADKDQEQTQESGKPAPMPKSEAPLEPPRLAGAGRRNLGGAELVTQHPQTPNTSDN